MILSLELGAPVIKGLKRQWRSEKNKSVIKRVHKDIVSAQIGLKADVTSATHRQGKSVL